MKQALVVLLFSFYISAAFSQETKTNLPDPTKKIQIVEASCGKCQFGLAGKSCDLAIRINGKAYYVDGTDIDSHGDAHAKDGFCNAIRKAEVQGQVEGDRFKLTYFKLLPGKVNKATVKGTKSKTPSVQ